ncbi:MAG: hypothetical protein PWP47_1452 [Synergistaceae bacterium]|jgi:hypothetical protein|nr:hypothetical protein [Synergistaceae bacterium]
MPVTEKSRWGKRTLILLLVLGIGGYFAFQVIRDAALDLSEGRIPAGIPDSILENITIDREVNGDLWKANVGKVERGKDWANLFSIDVEVVRGNGRVWTLKAPKGRYFEKNMRADITEPKGTMTDGTVLFHYRAPLAEWEQKSNKVVFPEGFEASGDLGLFEAGHMTLIPGGIMEADKGATVKWFDQGEKNR